MSSRSGCMNDGRLEFEQLARTAEAIGGGLIVLSVISS